MLKRLPRKSIIKKVLEIGIWPKSEDKFNNVMTRMKMRKKNILVSKERTMDLAIRARLFKIPRNRIRKNKIPCRQIRKPSHASKQLRN